MALLASQKRNFLRQVYLNGADEAARTAYLNGLLAKANAALTTGKTLTASSGAGVSVQFTPIMGYQPGEIQDLVDWAFDNISEATIDLALALVPRRGITLSRTSFSGLRG